MAKKAQVLIISLWILVILTVLAVSIGHRVSLSLRLSRYQRDGVKALYLAKAGVNRAISVLEADAKDTSGFDALCESWAEDKDIFEKIKLGDNDNEYATVSYVDGTGSSQENKYGVADEERRINLNTASAELLAALLNSCEDCAFADTQANEIVNYIRIWRGDKDPALNAEADDYKDFKKAAFANIEELVIAIESYYQKKGEGDYQGKAKGVYRAIRGLITVYGTGKINVNTASEKVLTILAESLALGTEQKNCAPRIAAEIIRLRNEKNISKQAFKSAEEIVLDLGGDVFCAPVVNSMQEWLIFNSDHYRIVSRGIVGRINKRVNVIYDRKNKRIASWQQN